MANSLSQLYQCEQTVFTFDEISVLWDEPDKDRLKGRLYYYVKQKDLIRLRQGIYATTTDYSKLELAGRVFSPSYISFQSALTRAGVIFQYREVITVASYCSKQVNAGEHRIRARKIKDSVLYNPAGIDFRKEAPVVAIAGAERALADLFYLAGEQPVDNPEAINWDKTLKICRLYNNKRLTGEMKKNADRYSET